MSTILIADDSHSARETLISILEGQGYQLFTAKNGSEALDLAQRIQPDVILLDVMMPGMDGFEVCRRMRMHPRLSEVPIILLTALDDRDSLLTGLNAGADDFLSKPIESQELRARVHTITRLNRYRTLLQQREDLQEMARRVIQAQEQERLRISREIHDDIGQALTVHQIGLKNIRDRVALESGEWVKSLQDLLDETSQIFTKLRLLAQDLRPPLLDTVGIKLALRAYCNDFARRSGLPVTYDVDNEIPDISDTMGVTLYRVLQESLSNVARHAQASQVWVTLSGEEQEISLTVQDNGRGIPDTERSKSGIGLQGMQERVTLAGGLFNLRSAPNQGTVITVRFPLHTEQSLSPYEAK